MIFTKDGDAKVNTQDLKNISSVILSLASCISSEDKNSLVDELKYAEYFINKYLVLGELRQNQKKNFDLLKKFDDVKFIQGHSREEIDKMRREIWGIYIESKGEREKLERELKEFVESM